MENMENFGLESLAADVEAQEQADAELMKASVLEKVRMAQEGILETVKEGENRDELLELGLKQMFGQESPEYELFLSLRADGEIRWRDQ